MKENAKGQTSSHTPSTIKNNTGAKVQNFPDIGKDLAEVWEFFRYVESTRLDCSLSTGILLGSVCRYVDYLL